MRLVIGLPVEGRLARHAADEIRSLHRRDVARRVHELAHVDVAGGDDAAHDPSRPQDARQRARVDVGDGDDVVAHEVVAQAAVRAPVAGDGRLLADDEPGDLRRTRFAVFVGDAVIPDLG